ncbi:hypothetical protein MPTK1_7g17670 [Marchantia polymorpha subsp. ruderalis]|uniref:Uncharacterized protein n=2 Tax=Marchantia polymorpha TaxID=3197 RepID=A0AAF6C0U7_MARPO|nr:hypothetical protein MARPO_0051s0103 [Marchantia polymorpha]BBN17881.1 hypothetical protein Mp_7g17670 [Marchantia polymorpha subsp. ruderalis]|eukprot:PTQ38505.1 hypothetical protein MARPO_0051s0103 [Marchantia polymorpha]
MLRERVPFDFGQAAAFEETTKYGRKEGGETRRDGVVVFMVRVLVKLPVSNTSESIGRLEVAYPFRFPPTPLSIQGSTC